jgi:glycine betaine catabolism B
MLQASVSAILGILFVGAGAFSIWSMFQASAKLKDRGANARLVFWHRVGGYVFIALFVAMTYFMVIRLKDVPDELSNRGLLHVTIASVMVPLIFAKVLVARYYKAYYNYLMPLGMIIFSLGFVLVSMTAGPYYLKKATVEEISLDTVGLGKNQIDMVSAESLMKNRCVGCHALDRVVSARKDAAGWLATINRMRALPGANIPVDDSKTILTYLVARAGVDMATPEGKMDAGKALVEARCAKCHDLERTFTVTKTPEEWKSTVARMVAYSPPDHFRAGETDEIIAYLSEKQTPEGVAKRTEKARENALKPGLGVPAKQPTRLDALATATRSNLPLIAIFGVVCVVFGALLLKRPSANTATVEKSPATTVAPPVKRPSPAPRTESLVMQLIRIEAQTADAKTLRFALPPEARFQAKPGQFLTFTWLVDGRKVTRSYSICSSPTQSGFVEITPKKVDGGFISNFLNDRVAIGLTVEAKGPFGTFVFDETKHPKIVLIAAGSGITPMMSMLRYIDERCLKTDVTLLYCVRTDRDVIFAHELTEMAKRLPNFRLALTLSAPDDTWPDARGRFNAEFLKTNVADLAGSTFFLCGPDGFMKSARTILGQSGVPESRIEQESFGPSGRAKPGDTATDGSVTFGRSGKTVKLAEGQSLLEAAEAVGVDIPSSCRQGQCGTCATKLVKGEVSLDADAGLTPELRDAGYTLTCVGHARGEVELDV